MRCQKNSRLRGGYRRYDRHGNSGSPDSMAYSGGSGGSNRQAGYSRPIIRPSSGPVLHVKTPEQPYPDLNRIDLPLKPEVPGSERSLLTLKSHHVNENYETLPSLTVSPPSLSPPVSPTIRRCRLRPCSESRHTSNKSLPHNTLKRWTLMQESKIKILGIPNSYWIKDIYFAMSKFGTVTKIDMQVGSRDNNAWVVFQPPPSNLPNQLLRVNQASVRYEILTPQARILPSPVDPARHYQEFNTIFANSINFCVQTAAFRLANMKEVHAEGRVQLTLDLKHKELNIQFPLVIDHESQNFNFRLPISQISHVFRTRNGSPSSSLIIPFNSPPQFFVQKKPKLDDENAFPTKERSWSIWSTWYRETDVIDSRTRRQLQTKPLMDRKGSAIIDIGRWTAYDLSFDNDALSGPKFEEFRHALGDFGVTMQDSDQFSMFPGYPLHLYNILQEVTVTNTHLGSSNKGSALNDLSLGQVHLTFPVRYQLEACLSNGFIKENSVTREFLEKLALMDSRQAMHILEKVVEKQHVYYNPMEIFEIRSKCTLQTSTTNHCVIQRSINITPTVMHVALPVIEISNRITRKHITDAERFIRVRFSDEKSKGPLRNMPNNRADALFNRVSHAMEHGIVVAGRHYEFLAFGNSQLREHSAYFYAPTSTKSAHDIRVTMGQFDHIKTVAKYGARLGQCFSTTRAMQTTVTVRKIPDIERNGYNFTDGVGKMSLFLAQMAAQDLGLQNAFDNPPSLYQFRLGGCKGVLSLDPVVTKKEVHIRPSQHKFEALYSGLEVVRCSSLATPFLNRQIIIILSYLGVPDHVFIQKQLQMMKAYELAMTDRTEAIKCLLKHIDMNQTTLAMASMVMDGFLENREPFMMSLLNLWRASTIKDLKKKARIAIGDGAFVLGCIDESGTLRGHYNDPQSRLDASREKKLETLPQIFIQIDDTSKKGHYKVIEGICVLARNPSLHPGDIRIVRAVDVPALHHHKNVVVLPQTGDRDLASMCSGGDLDGDDYMVLWDQGLLPETINVPPMDFTPVKSTEKIGPIDISDVRNFFVTYMKNDSLGRIAHAHLAQADQQDAGVSSHVCLELAKLHSQAVDYSKSGIPAVMDHALGPKRWPHFMEKDRPSKQIYRSKKILGILYDQVQLVDFKPVWEDNFDGRVINAFDLDEALLEKAAGIKADYDDALRKLMAKHGVKTEFEAFSVFVLVHNNEERDYKFAEEFGRTIGILKTRYRQACITAAGATSLADWDHLGLFVAAMYSITAKQMREAINECRTTKIVGGQRVATRKMDTENMPLMSFPWLFHSELGKLATESSVKTQLDSTQGQCSRKHHTSVLTNAEIKLDAVKVNESITKVGEMFDLDFEDAPAIPVIERQQNNYCVEQKERAERVEPNRSPPASSSTSRAPTTAFSNNNKMCDRW